MWRFALFLLATAFVSQGQAQDEDGPPISIQSPDEATTFAYGTVKTHSLRWNQESHMLIAQIVFLDVEPSSNTSNEDTHDFRLPGVSFDEAKGLFYAVSAKGESIPVARIRHELFLKVIEATPNAVVRIEHPHGRVHVALEALRPDDPALRSPAQPHHSPSVDPPTITQ